MSKIHILKLLDYLAGRLLCDLMKRPGPRNPQKTDILKILIIRPGGIGDAVLLVPSILAIQRKFPAAEIHVLAEKRNADVFSLCPGIKGVLPYESLHGLWTVLHNDYDAVIDTEQWHRLSAVVARLTASPILIGFSTNNRNKLLTHPIPYSHEEHEVVSFFKLLPPLGIHAPHEAASSYLRVPWDAMKKGESLLGDLAGSPFIVIFPSASIPERRWGAEKFGEIARSLQLKGIPAVIVGGRGDTALGDRIVMGTHGLNLSGRTTLAETAAIVAKASLLLSGDSGILHLGAGLGRPTVSLFGPGIAEKWAPRGENHIVIRKSLPCSPCTKYGYTPKCPRNTLCLAQITVEDVLEAVETLLKS